MSSGEPVDLNALLAELLATTGRIPTDGTPEGAKLHQTFALMAQRLAQLAGATSLPAGFHWTDPGFPRLDMEIHDLGYKLRVMSEDLPPQLFQANFAAVETLEHFAIVRQATPLIDDLLAVSGEVSAADRGVFTHLVQRLGILAGVPAAAAPGSFPTPDAEITQAQTRLIALLEPVADASGSREQVTVLAGLAREMQQRLALQKALGDQGQGVA